MSRSEDHILGIDASLSGLAGDMMISALMQLDPDGPKIMDIVSKKLETFFAIQNFNVEPIETKFQDFKGIKLKFNKNHVRIEDDFAEKFSKFVETIDLEPRYKKFVLDTIDIILIAETDLHQKEKLHLHELGTVDTFFDVCTIGLLLQSLKIKNVQISPLATGKGHVKISHGIVPIPAPATLSILEKYSIATVQGPNGEALTPTGAAIFASLITNFDSTYHATWIKNALGFGNKIWKDRGNFVRLRLGKTVSEASSISVLETNLDDVTGEILGYTVQKLLDVGALDVSYYPIFMKKNRPGYCLRVLVNKNLEDVLIDKIQYLTSTLGIRIFEIKRHVGQRRIKQFTKSIDGRRYTFDVKIGLFGSKVEFDDLIRISESLKMSPKKTEYILMENLENLNYQKELEKHD